MSRTFQVSIDLHEGETIEEALQELRKRLYAGFLPDFTVDYCEDHEGNEWYSDEMHAMLKRLPMPWEEDSTPSPTSPQTGS